MIGGRFNTSELGTRVIKTPEGDYIPDSNDLLEECLAAGRNHGWDSIKIFIDGKQMMEPVDFITNDLSAIAEEIRVEPYDKGA